ncbi:MAG: glycosyltransferase family 2 protein [Chroococcidiopsis sp.]
MKLVSVIVLIYNSEKYIAATLESVLSQTYHHIEVLLIDDGSPDKSIEICQQFNDSRIRIIRQQNSGLPGARNAGIRQALGDYLAFIDGDDLWRRDKLEHHVNHLANSAEVGVSFSRSAFIDEAGKFLGSYQTPKLKGITPSYLMRCNPVGNGSAAVVRREVFAAIAFSPRQYSDNRHDTLDCYFDEQFRDSGGDVDLWLRILLQTKWQIEGIPEALTLYRVHSSGLSAQLDRQLAAGEQLIAKLRTYGTPLDPNWEAVIRAYHLRYLARSAIRWKSDAIAVQLMHQAIASYWRIVLESPRQTVMTLIAAYLLLLVPRRLRAHFEVIVGQPTTIFQKLRTRIRIQN